MKKFTILTALCLTLSANADCYDDVTATTPDNRFTINADNTVTDNTTGLTWMRCSLGQTGNDCRGGWVRKFSWAKALNEVANNYSGWRLPNIKELSSIVELRCENPAINATIFPNTQSNAYWSSSPLVYPGDYAWAVSFGVGASGTWRKDDRNTRYYVRLVRSGL